MLTARRFRAHVRWRILGDRDDGDVGPERVRADGLDGGAHALALDDRAAAGHEEAVDVDDLKVE